MQCLLGGNDVRCGKQAQVMTRVVRLSSVATSGRAAGHWSRAWRHIWAEMWLCAHWGVMHLFFVADAEYINYEVIVIGDWMEMCSLFVSLPRVCVLHTKSKSRTAIVVHVMSACF